MLQLINHSGFESRLFLSPNTDGIDTMYAIAKARFSWEAPGFEPVPITECDTPHDGLQSLQAASELHLEKPGTDVVFSGAACAPDEQPVEALALTLAVAGRTRRMRAMGERVWTRGRLGFGVRASAPEPFTRLSLVYENAFGGTYVDDEGTSRCFGPNPIGRGYAGGRKPNQMIGLSLPSFEAEGSPVDDDPCATSMPVGFGPLPGHWEPRCDHAGTYDKTWQRARAPFLPSDFSPDYFHIAPPAWTFAERLIGGEPIFAEGFSPDGPQELAVPAYEVSTRFVVGRHSETMRAHLETVAIDLSYSQVTLTWRAAFVCDKSALRVDEVVVEAKAGVTA